MENKIVVPWKSQSDVWWNQTCANIIEVFGLPGDKYQTEVSTEAMIFYFQNEKDAFMCQLLVSEEI